MPTHRPSAARRILLVAVSIGAAGCGAEAYQSRIEGNSVPFFNYQRELESNLGPRWRSANGTVSLRLPPAFKVVPPPKKKKDDSSAAVRDPRIPPGFGADLPGLVGGFRGTMKAEQSGGKTTEVPVHAFVLTNQFLLNSRDPKAKPGDYDKQLVAALAAGLAVRPASDFRQYSATESFKAVPDLAKAAEFSPDFRLDRLLFEPPPSGVPVEWQVFIRRVPPLQVAVIYAVPKAAARDEQLRKRIDLSLQSLRVEPAGGAGATAPSPSSGGTTGPAM